MTELDLTGLDLEDPDEEDKDTDSDSNQPKRQKVSKKGKKTKKRQEKTKTPKALKRRDEKFFTVARRWRLMEEERKMKEEETRQGLTDRVRARFDPSRPFEYRPVRRTQPWELGDFKVSRLLRHDGVAGNHRKN